MKRKYKKLIFGTSIIMILFSFVLCAYAAWRVNSYTYNFITTPSFGIEILEDYIRPEEGVFPGMEVTKKVEVKNIGETDSLVRVRFEKAFGDWYGDKFRKDTNYDPEVIILNTNSEYWTFNEEDGWYYYNQILKEDEVTKEPILNSFKLLEAVGNYYTGKDAQIVVKAESVQYDGNGVSLWGKTYDELGIEEPKDTGNNDVTKVTFLNEFQKFDIELSKTDLFANFKGLLPGTSRTQKIQVKNAYDKDVNIRLVFMQDTKDNVDEAYELLHKYVTVNITDDKGNKVYSGPISGKGDCYIGLGVFKNKEVKNLTVNLSVDPEMTEDWQNLSGKVKWVFEANEVTTPKKTSTPVRTALVQTSDTGLFNIGFVIMLLGIVGVIMGKRLSRRDEGC